MTSQQLDNLEKFLDRFFGQGNELTREKLASGASAMARCAQKWLEGFHLTQRRLLLPRWRGGQHIDWYAIAFSDKDFRDLRDQLMAFVGPSFSTFRGERSILDPNDSVEAAIIDFADRVDPLVFRFQAGTNRQDWDQLADALDLMYHVCETEETRPPQTERHRATGRVLRDFYVALAAGNRDDANDALQYLRTHHRLEALNLQFLEVQLLTELGLWKDVLALPTIGDLVRVRHPRAVLGALIQAVYNCHLAHSEKQADIAEACRVFQYEVYPQFAALYQARRGLTIPEVLKSFMLRAVTETPQRPDLRDEILAIPNIPPSDQSYLNKLAELIPSTAPETITTVIAPPIDQTAMAREALEHVQHEKALELASIADFSIDRTKILLECAYELQTIDSEKLAVESIEALTSQNRDLLFQSRKYLNFWQTITKSIEEATSKAIIDIHVPGNWLEWLERLSDPSIPPERTLHWSASGVDEWSIETFIETPDISDVLISALDAATRNSVGSERLVEALPHLLRFLEKDAEYPRPAFVRLYERLRMEFAYSCDTGTVSDFAVFGDLCGTTLELGLDSEGYSSLLDEAKYLWANFASPSNLRSMLDILDRLVYFVCPKDNQSARSELAIDVFTKATPWIQSGRIDPESWRFLKQLAIDLQLTQYLADIQIVGFEAAEELNRTAEQDPLSELTGTVAIYTLTEPAGIRVRDILKQRSPQCMVKVNCDKVGSPHLKELARNADVFVIVTSSAKHAATSFIEKHRRNRPILKPLGKGTSSILQELVNYTSSMSRISTTPSPD